MPKTLPDSIASMSQTEAEMADDLKRRFAEALTPMLEVMSEAHAKGFALRWAAIAPTPPDGKHRMMGLVAIRQKIF